MDNFSDINKKSLVNILTLRYDPSITPKLVPKTPDDFTENESNYNNEKIENIICEEIVEKLDQFDDNNLSIALSGGVDSSLSLALFRKLNPEKKIHAISLKFSESIDETPSAAKIAEKFNADHHVVYFVYDQTIFL